MCILSFPTPIENSQNGLSDLGGLVVSLQMVKWPSYVIKLAIIDQLRLFSTIL